MASVENERFDASRFTPPWIRNEHLQRFAFASALVRDAVVVDCACGTGVGTRLFAESGALRVHAFDFSDTAIAATDRACGGLKNVIAAKADATRLPLPDKSADVYISFETIEHVNDATAILLEARRVLKSGGIFICSTPNRYVYSPGDDGFNPWNKFHVQEYNITEFDKILSSVFSNRKIYGQNPISRRQAYIKNRIGRLVSSLMIVRLNQFLKLARFFYDRPEHHRVEKKRLEVEYEYIIMVCSV